MSSALNTNPALLPGIGPAAQPAAAPTRTPGKAPGATPPAGGPAFADVLKRAGDTAQAPARAKIPAPPAAGAGETLHFSRHALERVRRRGIELDHTTLTRLNEGVARAAGKGSRDSVVLLDGTAFVVSVGNRTVITAVDAQHMREHVFTNIDSAVIA